MSTEISFGAWLRQRRRRLDLTQQTLADQVGCARITVRRIEADVLKPSKELAQILLEKLGIPVFERPQWINFARGLSDIPQQASPQLIPGQRSENLPAALTAFIGRENEQARTASLLAAHRLATLTGPGGVGKTRLALQAGQSLLDEYPNGVWFIPLDSLSDPALVLPTAASIFDLRAGPDHALVAKLTHYLRPRTTLLILDNCEHLLDACAQLITTLLQNCPKLKILATSREALGVAGEALYPIPPLALPDRGDSIDYLDECESTRLFRERAQLVQMDFGLTKENAPAIVQICRQLEGIPLAIELAAARVNLLDVKEISRQLNECFSLLVSGSRVPLPRHQTMQASMDWSWDLLTEEEQTQLRQLSVFAGGWTLESARGVGDGDVSGLISSLVKKSLIVVNQAVGPDRRYRFHEIVRQYAHEKLVESGEEEKIRTRQMNYLLQLSQQAEPALRGPAQIEWYARLKDERDNVRAALEWADQTDLEAGLYISSRLERLWARLDLREGSFWLLKFLQKTDSHVYPGARAAALRAHGWMLGELQQFDLLHSSARECLALYRALGDQQGEVDGLVLLAWASPIETEKLELLNQALELAQALGDLRRQMEAHWFLGWLYAADTRFVFWEKAIALARPLEDLTMLAFMLSTIGWFLVINNEIESAQKYLDESTALYQQLDLKPTHGSLVSAYGQIALIGGDFERARAFFQENARIASEHGNRQSYVWSQAHLGYVALREGKLTEARDIFAETVQEFQNDSYTIGVVYTLEGMVSLAAKQGQTERAAQLLGWADATREMIEDFRQRMEQADIDRDLAPMRAQPDQRAFAAAYAKGRAMTMEQAIATAIEKQDV